MPRKKTKAKKTLNKSEAIKRIRNIRNALEDHFVFFGDCVRWGIIVGGAAVVLLRAASMECANLLKQGAYWDMTQQQLERAALYDKLEPWLDWAVTGLWIAGFVAKSAILVMIKFVKYGHGAWKGLLGDEEAYDNFWQRLRAMTFGEAKDSSRYRKRRQGAWRLLFMLVGFIIATAAGATTFTNFIQLLQPLVGFSGIGAIIVGALFTGFYVARIILFAVKKAQQLYNWYTLGTSNVTIAERFRPRLRLNPFPPHTSKEDIEKFYQGVSDPAINKLVEGASHYKTNKRRAILFRAFGICLALLLAAALITTLYFTLPISALFVCFGAVYMGDTLGYFLGTNFSSYPGMKKSSAASWAILTLTVTAMVTLSIFSFGAPMAIVAAAGVAMLAVSAVLIVNGAINDYKRHQANIAKGNTKTKEELEFIKIRRMASINNLALDIDYAVPTKELRYRLLDYLAATHLVNHNDYQKNGAKIEQNNIFKELAKEIGKSYYYMWKELKDNMGVYQLQNQHQKNFAYTLLTLPTFILGTGRLALSIVWTVLPIRRFVDYGINARRDIQSTADPVERVGKRIGYTLGGILGITFDIFYGTRYGDKIKHYKEKKATHKKAMRDAEEAAKIVASLPPEAIYISHENGKVELSARESADAKQQEKIAKAAKLLDNIQEQETKRQAHLREKAQKIRASEKMHESLKSSSVQSSKAASVFEMTEKTEPVVESPGAAPNRVLNFILPFASGWRTPQYDTKKSQRLIDKLVPTLETQRKERCTPFRPS